MLIKRVLAMAISCPGRSMILAGDPFRGLLSGQTMVLIPHWSSNSLQYEFRLRAINEIPSIEIPSGSDSSELTVVMMEDSEYVVSSKDLDQVVFMAQSRYPLRETAGAKRCLDLVIEETLLNSNLFQAVKMTNEIVHTTNRWLANPKCGSNVVSRLVRKEADVRPFLNDLKAPGRLTKVVATVEMTKLAITYNVEGRRESRYNIIQKMA